MHKTFLLASCSLFILAGCTTSPTPAPSTPDNVVSYDANSRKTMIPDSCQSFYDGCNQCNKVGDSTDAACTKMYCEQYEQPYCTDTDKVIIDETMTDGPSTDETANSETLGVNIDKNAATDYIGLTIEQAQSLAETNGVPFRVVAQDDEVFAVTMDYRPGRINATVRDGLIVSVDVEGMESQ